MKRKMIWGIATGLLLSVTSVFAQAPAPQTDPSAAPPPADANVPPAEQAPAVPPADQPPAVPPTTEVQSTEVKTDTVVQEEAKIEETKTDTVAQSTTTVPADYPFDVKVDTWVAGTIVTLDADAKKLKVRGRKFEYASEYAKMMKELDDKLKDVDPAQRETKRQEILKDWQEELDEAAAKEPGRESDFDLKLPDDEMLAIHNLSELKKLEYLEKDKGYQAIAVVPAQSGTEQALAPGQQPEKTVAVDGLQPGEYAGTSQEEIAAIHTLSQLKVGEQVIVGYDAGLLSSEALAILSVKDLPTAPAEPKK